MKLFKKSAKEIPDQRKIEELEIELGFTPVVTEENFEREFDRAVIEDYREKHGNSWTLLQHAYHRSSLRGNVDKQYWDAEQIGQETWLLLMLEESRKAFRKEFDPDYNGKGYW